MFRVSQIECLPFYSSHPNPLHLWMVSIKMCFSFLGWGASYSHGVFMSKTRSSVRLFFPSFFFTVSLKNFPPQTFLSQWYFFVPQHGPIHTHFSVPHYSFVFSHIIDCPWMQSELLLCFGPEFCSDGDEGRWGGSNKTIALLHMNLEFANTLSSWTDD